MGNAGRRVVVITGCGTGIGRALAVEMHSRGERVVATARDIGVLAPLDELGIATAEIDVTDSESIATASKAILAEEGRVDVLVNNAGRAGFGPLAEYPIEEARVILETNLVGPIAMVQAFFPQMAERGTGTIVNVGSMVGVVGTPFTGAYNASKSAIHMVSDTLRMELAPFGIDVVQVQPGAVESAVAEKSASIGDRYTSPESKYAPIADRIAARVGMSQSNAMPADEFARRLADKLSVDSPPRRIRIGNGIGFLPILERLPKTLLGAIFSRRFGLDRLRAARSPLSD